MTFLPDLRLEIALNAGVRTAPASRVWTDISAYCELDRGITITGGRADQQSVTETGRMTLTLDNTDGRFTPERASSPYYPNIKIGRPIRLRANLLTNGQCGTFETDITGWSGTNATLARATTPVHGGVGALQITCSTAANIFANHDAGGTSGKNVVALKDYTAEVWARHNGVARDARVDIAWYDAGGALLSTATGPTTTLTTTYQQITNTATAPTGAAFARYRACVVSAGVGEVFFFDDCGLLLDRFLGFVDEWPLEWDQAVDSQAESVVTASGRLGLLGQGETLHSIIEEDIGIDGPLALWTMGDSSGATNASESAGNSQPKLKPLGIGKSPVFGTATGPPTDGLTACTIGPASFGSNGKWLSAYVDKPGGGDWTVEMFFSFTTGGNDILSFGTRFGVQWDGIHLVLVNIKTGTTIATGTKTGLNSGNTNHLALRYTAATTTIELFVNGVLDASGTVTDAGNDGRLDIGNRRTDSSNATDDSGNSQFTFPGLTVAQVAITYAALSTTRLLSHVTAGTSGFSFEQPGARLARYVSYAGLTAADIQASNGDALISHIDTTDKTVLEVMRLVETTDGGVLFDRRDGKLGYFDKGVRYQAASLFTLDVLQQHLDAGVRPILDKTLLVNDVTTKNLTDSLNARARKTSSVLDYGKRDLEIELATDDDDLPFQTASWIINHLSTPHTRIPTLAPVDVLTLPADLMAAVIAADIANRFTVTHQPSQAAASTADYFIEGFTEVITTESWVRVFNVSSSALYDVWLLDSSTRSQLDSTTILAL